MHPCQKKAMPGMQWRTYPATLRYFLLGMRIFVVLLDRKSKQFSYLYDGIQFANVLSELSIRFGSDLEPHAKKNRVRTFRDRTGNFSASSWAGVPRDEGRNL
jgi:hypothetical protein